MNMQKLLKQAQEMQERMQRELSEVTTEASVGGGMVTVKMDGHRRLLQVRIEPEAIDPDDPSLLEDLIVAASNAASTQLDDILRERVGSMTGGAFPNLF